MHPKMMERNKEVFREKFRENGGDSWLKAHMRVRFSSDERKELIRQLNKHKEEGA